MPPVQIHGTRNQRLYQNYWYEMSGFHFRVPNGRYRVRLHFAETWGNQVGERRFDVRIQKQPALTAMDVFKETGGKCRALVKEFEASVEDGLLTVDFSPAHDSPTHSSMISGIEVVEHC